MITTENKNAAVGLRLRDIGEFILGKELFPDIWGGVGIACFDWHPTEPNLLAAVTLKTNKLEVWRVDEGKMISIVNVAKPISYIRWLPSESTKIIMKEYDSTNFHICDYVKQAVAVATVHTKATTFCCHPSRPGHIMYGTAKGDVILIDVLENVNRGLWETDKSLLKLGNDRQIRDIVCSPGEDVFLVLRADDKMCLYGIARDEIKMKFEVPPGGVNRAVWVDSISGDFLVVSQASGVIRIYNAAQPACKEILKVSRHAILDIRRMTSEVYLIKLLNGQITQFNIKTRKTLFTTDVGHTHQI